MAEESCGGMMDSIAGDCEEDDQCCGRCWMVEKGVALKGKEWLEASPR